MATMNLFRSARQRPRRAIREENTAVRLEGRTIPLRIRRHPRARQITLRVDPVAGGAVVTLPSTTPVAEGVAMVHRKADWLLDHLKTLAPRRPFADGVTVPLLGEVHIIRHRPDVRGVVYREAGALVVCGRAEHLGRRLTDWLKAEARREFAMRARVKAMALGARMGRITVRDTRSRWGSCSAGGNLSFCWRLIFAPVFVVDYVIAHEVAHLRVRNHGPRFWQTVAGLTDDVEGARAWLNRHGESLHRFG